MKRLNKAQMRELEKLQQAVVDAAEALNAARTEFEQFREEMLDAMTCFADDRSERWRESEAGEAYTNWVAAWEEEICEEVVLACEEYPCSPEDL